MAVVLLRAHEDTDFTRQVLKKLCGELPDLKVIVLAYRPKAPVREGLFAGAHVVTGDDVATSPYPERLAGFDPEHLTTAFDIPVLHYFHAFPSEDYYWIVEYDVHYTGHWGSFFRVLARSGADLLGTTMLAREDSPEWVHWPSLRWDAVSLPASRCIKSFMPFARLSNAALRTIDSAYRKGLTGHFEATWPTACRIGGLRIEDIGGFGPFTPWRWRGKHYTNTMRSDHLCPGTFIFRPVYARAEVDGARLRPMLWHPVKS